MFSAGVILFMMVTQCQPFEKAKVNDNFYKFIAGNMPHMFWDIYKKVVPLSEELKDLLTGMMQLDPSARFTLDEILAHPWVQGPVPNPEEIRKEFEMRKKANDIAKLAAKKRGGQG